jgi:hypothetical protein
MHSRNFTLYNLTPCENRLRSVRALFNPDNRHNRENRRHLHIIASGLLADAFSNSKRPLENGGSDIFAQPDEHVVTVDLDFMHGKIDVGRRQKNLAGADVKLCAVPRADDRVAVQSPRDQLPAVVGTPVIRGPKSPANMEQGDRAITNLHDGLARIGQIGNSAHANESAGIRFGFHPAVSVSPRTALNYTAPGWLPMRSHFAIHAKRSGHSVVTVSPDGFLAMFYESITRL